MRNRKLRILDIFILFFSLAFTPIDLLGYDNKENGVHETASKKAWAEVIGKRDFLQDLGLTADDVLYQDNKAVDWITFGSKAEDEPVTRTLHHFYDPTKATDKRGLNDPCGSPLPGYSATLWGLSGTTINEWDIKAARTYEYIALTGRDLDGSPVSDAQGDKGRKKHFAHMFRALGHVMHLVHDSAVPEHARNDGHAYDRSIYEPYIYKEAIKGTLNYDGYQLVKFPAYDCYFDTGTDECSYISDGQGIAEFTNRNFVSQSTNFDDTGICRKFAGIYEQPQPEFSHDEEETVSPLEGGTKTVWVHYVGNTVRDYLTGEAIENPYLSAYSWWNFEADKEEEKMPVFSLSGKCFKSAANFAIPRAVGYSAGVLDYFFRGKIDVVEDEDVDGYVIKNDSDEDMDGTFELYYDTKSNERKQIQSGDFPLETSISAKGKSSKITFTPPDDAKEPDKYILVFQGNLGNEDGAVVGKSCTIEFGPAPYVLVVQESLEFDKTTLANVAKGKFYFVFNDKGIDNPQAREALARKMTIKVASSVSYFKVNEHSMPLIDGYYQWRGEVDGWEITGEPATWELRSLVGSKDIIVSYTKPEWPQASFGIAYIWNWGSTSHAGYDETYSNINIHCEAHCCAVKAVDWVNCPPERQSGYMYWGTVHRIAPWTLQFRRRYLPQLDFSLAFQLIRDQESQAWTLPDTYPFNPAWKYRKQWNLDCYSPTPPWLQHQEWWYGCTGPLDEGCSIDWWYNQTFNVAWAYGVGCASGGTGTYGYVQTNMTVSSKTSITAQYSRTDNRRTVEKLSQTLTGSDWSGCEADIAPTAQCFVDIYKKEGGVCIYVGHINPTGYTPECYPYALNVDFVVTGNSKGDNISNSTKVYKEPYELIKFEMNPSWTVTQWLNTNKYDLTVIPETILNFTGYAHNPDVM